MHTCPHLLSLRSLHKRWWQLPWVVSSLTSVRQFPLTYLEARQSLKETSSMMFFDHNKIIVNITITVNESVNSYLH